MIPNFCELFCVDIFHLPAADRVELAEFYAWIGSAPFIVFRVRSEVELRLSNGSSDEPTEDGDRHAHEILSRLFDQTGAKHLEREAILDIRDSAAGPRAAAAIGDARALSRASMGDWGAVKQISDQAAAAAAAAFLVTIDPTINDQSEEVRTFRGMHWFYTGTHIRTKYAPWLSATRLTKEMNRMGLPVDPKLKEFSRSAYRSESH